MGDQIKSTFLSPTILTFFTQTGIPKKGFTLPILTWGSIPHVFFLHFCFLVHEFWVIQWRDIMKNNMEANLDPLLYSFSGHTSERSFHWWLAQIIKVANKILESFLFILKRKKKKAQLQKSIFYIFEIGTVFVLYSSSLKIK